MEATKSPVSIFTRSQDVSPYQTSVTISMVKRTVKGFSGSSHMTIFCSSPPRTEIFSAGQISWAVIPALKKNKNDMSIRFTSMFLELTYQVPKNKKAPVHLPELF